MSRRSFSSRAAAIAVTLAGTVAMLGVSFDAEAQRRLGGSSLGRQSSNVTQMRAPATPPAATPARPAAGQPGAPAAAAAGTGAAAGTAARSGASRWFGPIAGIAAGLGLAALFTSLGMGAALAEFIASFLLIALVAFAVLFLVRRLMGGARRPAMEGANGATPMQRTAHPREPQQAASLSRRAGVQQSVAHTAVASTTAPPVDKSWYVPAGFDTQQFLQNAKQHFIALQAAWDRNDVAEMREFMADELLEAVREPLSQREPGGHTDVVLLNAELLGVEDIPEGNLASVRFSGMLKDDSGPEAYRFEEIWNFLKPTQGGWVLAGIQQIPVEYES